MNMDETMIMAASPAGQPVDACVHSVLVVDDDPDELSATVRILGTCYPALSATCGADAPRIALLAHPSVIILDVMMPGGKDGFAVFHELRRNPQTCDIPVIFLTGVNRRSGLPFGADEVERHLGGRPAAFLEKPVSAETLLQTVSAVLRKGNRPVPPQSFHKA